MGSSINVTPKGTSLHGKMLCDTQIITISPLMRPVHVTK